MDGFWEKNIRKIFINEFYRNMIKVQIKTLTLILLTDFTKKNILIINIINH